MRWQEYLQLLRSHKYDDSLSLKSTNTYHDYLDNYYQQVNSIHNNTIDLGIYIKSRDVSLKNPNINLDNHNILTHGDVQVFNIMRNDAAATTFHHAVSIANLGEISGNNAISCYVPFTTKDHFISSFLDVKSNDRSISAKSDKFFTHDLGNVKIGFSQVNTIENGSMVEAIYNDKRLYNYYPFSSNLDINNIQSWEDIPLEDKKLLIDWLKNSNSSNYDEFGKQFYINYINNITYGKINSMYTEGREFDDLNSDQQKIIKDFLINSRNVIIEVLDNLD